MGMRVWEGAAAAPFRAAQAPFGIALQATTAPCLGSSTSSCSQARGLPLAACHSRPATTSNTPRASRSTARLRELSS
eukprot:2056703-Pleurochrysis_carterae.AAC.1